MQLIVTLLTLLKYASIQVPFLDNVALKCLNVNRFWKFLSNKVNP